MHVIGGGILHAERYGDMLAASRAEYRGRTGVYCRDVLFDESLSARNRAVSTRVRPERLREWYLLGLVGERLVLQSSSAWSTPSGASSLTRSNTPRELGATLDGPASLGSPMFEAAVSTKQQGSTD
jgi:hypothetical protein